VSGIETTGAAPRCRDKDDQIFIDLAFAARADALVTGDADLLSLVGASTVPILSPAELCRRIVRNNDRGNRDKKL
jgi:predicted nucleic acid-binding protein